MKRFLEFFIRGDNKQFKDTVKDTKKESNKFADFMGGIGKKLIAALAVTAIIAGFRKLINTMIETADRVSDLSDMTGMATDTIQEYQYVARMAGVSTEAVTNAATQLTRRFQNLHSEASPISRAFKTLGIEAKTASGELRNTGDIVDETLKSLADMENATERNALGAQMFGGAWQDLAPILAMGSEGIEKLKNEAHELGGVMSKETIAQVNKLREEKERLSTVATGLGRELGSFFIPILADLSTAALSAFKSLKRLRDESTAFRDPVSKAASETDKFLESIEGLDAEMRKSKANEYYRNLIQRQKELSDQAERANEVYEEALKKYGNMSIVTANAAKQADALQEEYESVGHQLETLMANKDKWIDQGQKDNQIIIEQIGLLQGLREKLDEATEARDKSTDPLFIQRQNELISGLKEQIAYIEQFTGKIQHATQVTEDLTAAEALLNDMTVTFDEMGDAVERSTDKFALWFGQVVVLTEGMERLTEVVKWWGEDMMWAGVNASSSLKEYGKTVLDVTRRNIAAYLAESVAAAIKGTMAKFGPIGIAMTPVAGGLAAAAFNAAIPAFADGGAAFGPTLAMVGEAPGISKSNPEYIGTADQLGLSKGSSEVRFRMEGDMLEGVQRKRKQMEIYF